jgi:transposase
MWKLPRRRAIGVGSARKIARITQDDVAFRWIVGEQKVSHNRFSEFRLGHQAALDKLFRRRRAR